MPATATAIGVLLGLGTQIYSNALRKLPLMRHPWEHVLGMGIGAFSVNQLVKWNEKIHEDLGKMIDKSRAANERRYFSVISTTSTNEESMHFCNRFNRVASDCLVLDSAIASGTHKMGTGACNSLRKKTDVPADKWNRGIGP